jgi:hypothetical protein
MRFLISYVRLFWIFVIAPAGVHGQYLAGEALDQQALDTQLMVCENMAESSTIGGLLTPVDGQAIRVVWINLFASW